LQLAQPYARAYRTYITNIAAAPAVDRIAAATAASHVVAAQPCQIANIPATRSIYVTVYVQGLPSLLPRARILLCMVLPASCTCMQHLLTLCLFATLLPVLDNCMLLCERGITVHTHYIVPH
jgi:hypothetical protein